MQSGPQWAKVLKTMCPNLEKVVKSFGVMVQRRSDQLMDILLTGCWWGKLELASSVFWFQPVWGLHASVQHTVNFFYLVGTSLSAKLLKVVVMTIPQSSLDGGTRTLPQGCTVVSWLFLSCLCIPSLLWLATVWTCPWELREGHGGWMKPISCNQNGGKD